MLDSVETDLLGRLQAMQAQRAVFDGEARKLAERCRAEHAGSAGSAGDVEMADADANNDPAGPAQAAAAGGSTLCRSCYNDFLTLVSQTYKTPAQAQWYSAQKATFLPELDRRLDDVRALRTPLRDVDGWIAGQKRAWLQGQLQATAAFEAAGHVFGGTAPLLPALLDDPATEAPERLRAAVATAKGGPAAGELDRWVQDAMATARALQQPSSPADAGEQGALFRDSLYPDGVPDVAAARAIERRLLAGDVGLDQALGEVLRAVGGAEAGAEEERAAKIAKHQKRLAELRRAKAAHEAQKLKKMKPVDVPYFLQGDAPCAACGKASDPQKSPFCIVCFLEVDSCLRENQTVWCSTACMRENYASHFAATHPCAAGDRCARSKPESGIVRQEPRYFFCRECVLSFSISTVYCSDRCAGRDFQRHREKVHLPNREMRADYHDDRSDLSYSSFAKIDYTAADIAKHLLSLDEAVASCQKKHPDWTLTEARVQLTLPWST